MLRDLLAVISRMRRPPFEGERVACNLCGSEDHRVVGTRDRHFRRLTNVLCRDCGLVFVNPMPTEEELGEYYRSSYRRHYQAAATPRKVSVVRAFDRARSRLRLLEPVLRPGDRVLDLGCGGGEFVAVAREAGLDAVGVEPDASYAEHARKSHGVPVMTGRWQDAPVEDGSFDLVTLHHVLEHFRDPLGALRQVRGWLREGGVLHLEVPDVHDPDATPYARFHVAHLHSFCRETLLMMARRVGFVPHPETTTESTTLVLTTAAPEGDWLLHPEAPAMLARFFAEHTNRRYFLSATPYVRWIRRVSRLMGARWRAWTGGAPDAAPGPVAAESPGDRGAVSDDVVQDTEGAG